MTRVRIVRPSRPHHGYELAPAAEVWIMPANPVQTMPAQIVIYGPQQTTSLEGQAVNQDDGSIELTVPYIPAPPAGTPVQVILYPPGADPIVIEGTTSAPYPDGSFDIIPVG